MEYDFQENLHTQIFLQNIEDELNKELSTHENPVKIFFR